MRYTSIIHCDGSHNTQSDFSGPEARNDFKRRCESMGATWGHLLAEKTGKLVCSYAPEAEHLLPAAEEPSATIRRLRQSQELMATAVIADLAQLVGVHGDRPLMFAIPDEGAFNVERPRFDTDGEDGCFLI